MSIAAKCCAFLAVSTALHAQSSHEHPSYLRLQVLLDRAHFSPGEIDGVSGENTRKALRLYRAAHGLREVADFGPRTLHALEGKELVPTFVPYTVTEDDLRGPFVTIPPDLMAQASLPAMGYQSPEEALAEKFHINPSLLKRLNKDKDLSNPGAEIQVPNLRQDVPSKASKIVVSKSKHWLEALNAAGHVIADECEAHTALHVRVPKIGAGLAKCACGRSGVFLDRALKVRRARA